MHTCRKSPSLNWSYNNTTRWKANKVVWATYFPPLSKHRPDVLKSTLTNKNQIIKLTITQMHTHFRQLYIAGDFPYLTDVVRISGREWGPTRPSHHLNLFPIHVVFAISVRVNNPWPNAMFFQFPNVLHFHVLFWKSIQSCAIDYFKSHLLAQHSKNEGESATDLEWYSI